MSTATSEWITFIGLGISLLSAAANFGMMLIHWRRDTKKFAHLQSQIDDNNNE